MKKRVNLAGQTFGRWFAMGPIFIEGKRSQWLCICECGEHVKPIQSHQLLSGNSQSCGCLQKERTREAHIKHGLCQSSTYSSWRSMKCRCDNPSTTGYEYYGGRGITYDPRWKTFELFYEDMGERPERATLDRIDNNKGYYKDNCRWVNESIQSHNQRKRSNCTSQYRGVSWSSQDKIWISKIVCNGLSIYIGSFSDEESAALAYDQKAHDLYGENANLNFS
jgi:hypothetical protein